MLNFFRFLSEMASRSRSRSPDDNRGNRIPLDVAELRVNNFTIVK